MPYGDPQAICCNQQVGVVVYGRMMAFLATVGLRLVMWPALSFPYALRSDQKRRKFKWESYPEQENEPHK